MPQSADQILTVAQMRVAEDRLIAAGSSVEALMDEAGRGAAQWVWRMAAGRPVTVLCGPGNNGGDGYVIAEVLRERGLVVQVIAPMEPKTDAARTARARYRGEVFGTSSGAGEVVVDCLYGSGLTRALRDEDLALLCRLVETHRQSIAIDLPSGITSDNGAALNPGLPHYDLTLALGAWKFAHWLMPASAGMGMRRLVGIGVEQVPGAAQKLTQPHLTAPEADSHKYRRGLLAVVAGAMPGAALLACAAAQRSGAGYVKLLAGNAVNAPPELVIERSPLSDALADERINAALIGPGLGRDDAARERLAAVLAANRPTVLDADALMILECAQLQDKVLIVTPHEGELARLEEVFGLDANAAKPDRAATLAKASGMTIVAKGPDTVIAAPDGRLVCAPSASPWLSTAGTGDVLAGIIASRLACGAEPFDAACQGVWLHGEAARLCAPAFTPADLALTVPLAVKVCL